MKCLLLLVAVAAAVSACATSRGSLFQDAAETERKQAPAQQESEPVEAAEDEMPWEPEYYEEDPAATRGLEIRSDPDGAEVYLDGRYMGTTPLVLADPPRGRFLLTLTKEGFYPYSTSITHLGDRSLYSFSLTPITGFLRVRVSPPDASVSVGFRTYDSGRVQELPIGRYSVRVRSFGYQEYTETVVVRERELTELAVTLHETAFAVSDYRTNRSRFNPRNPGALGTVRLSFDVSSFGTGSVAILGPSGEEVFRSSFDRFTTWNQELLWNGRRGSGEALPDGTYTIRLRALGEPRELVEEREVEVRIDSSLVLGFRSLASGGAGLLYASAPDLLPGGSVQLSTLVLAHRENADGGNVYRVPVVVGARWGIGGGHSGDFSATAFSRWELDVQAGAIVGYADALGEGSLVFLASAALKTLLLAPSGGVGLGAALQTKLSLQGVSTDTLANSTGFSVGVPLALRMGRVSLLLDPELILALWEVDYEAVELGPPGFYPWVYARAGLLVDLGVLSAGLSLSARTRPFTQGLGVDLPFQAALEIHWLIPKSSLFLSCALAGEFSPPEGFYLQGGAGLGLLH